MFFENYNIPTETKIAAISSGTAMALKKIGYNADYIGDTNSMSKTASEFSEILGGNNKAVFPIGEDSRQSVQKELSGNCTWMNFKFYTTVALFENTIMQQIDACFLSSPSQAKALNINKLNKSEVLFFCFKGSTSAYLATFALSNKIITNFDRKEVYKEIFMHLPL